MAGGIVTHELRLLANVGAAIALLVVLVSGFRLHAFLALLLAALFLGLLSGMPAAPLLAALQQGVGDVLGFVAPVLALGAMLGRLLTASGGADRIAHTLVDRFGPRRVHWAMLCAALLTGIPLFFEIGFVLLVPLMFVIAARAGVAPMKVAIALLAGLSVLHGLVPPHPGPTIAVLAYGADMGKTLLYGLVVALPTAVLAGPLFGSLISRVVPGRLANDVAGPALVDAVQAPGVGMAVATILLPVLLMLLRSAADASCAGDAPLRLAADWLGNPVVALLLTLLLALYTLGARCGLDRRRLLTLLDESLRPIAAIVLIIGAGGGFKQLLIATGVGDVVGRIAAQHGTSPLVLAWSIAGVIRIVTGSATVAVITGSGLIAPLLPLYPGVSRELLVLATGAGSLMLSHVNDAGFWLVKEYFRLGLGETLRTWTLMETLIALIALPLILALSLLV
ncbi:MAG: gluconate:H+ symporter [Gammaproteobacteria bacterium]|nr:gluconate:H+ symporter [Gammaproteobacteria bacterium]